MLVAVLIVFDCMETAYSEEFSERTGRNLGAALDAQS